MSISRAVTPRCCIRRTALASVRPVVPKPGMVKRLDAVARHAERVERLAGDQQGQRRVEPAGDADGDGRLADVFEPLGEAGDLGVEDLLAALAQLRPGRAARTDGRRCRAPVRRCGRRRRTRTAMRRNSRPESRQRLVEAVVVRSRSCAQAVEIDVGDEQAGSSRRKRGDSARSVPFSAIRQWPPKTTSVVDSRDAARGVDVAGDAAARLADDELPAIGRLADDLVAGRQVEQHGRAGQRLERARRNRHPQVFADLDADDDVRIARRGEEQIGAERDIAGPPSETCLLRA